jgi:hypothetical protein
VSADLETGGGRWDREDGRELQILAGSLGLPLSPAKDFFQVVEEPTAHLEVRDRIFSPLAPEDPISGDSEHPAYFFFRQKGLIHGSLSGQFHPRNLRSGVTSAMKKAVFSPAPFQDGDAERQPSQNSLDNATFVMQTSLYRKPRRRPHDRHPAGLLPASCSL